MLSPLAPSSASGAGRSHPRLVRSGGLRWIRALLVGVLTVLAIPSCVEAQRAYPALRTRQGAYEMQVLVHGAPARTFHHRGETYLLGHQGDRYTIRIINNSGRRVEAVISVDGRDVLDGGAASYRDKRGYLVPAWGHVDVDGWRMSTQEVAAFRFSSVADSYAAAQGNAREVGVIGVAIFPEREQPVAVRPPVYVPEDPRPYPYRPYPYDDGYSLGNVPSHGAPAGRDSARGGTADGEAPSSPRAMDESSRGRRAPSASGGAYAEQRGPAPESRPGLGTEFGERRYSSVSHVQFLRAHPTRPAAMLGGRYNDRRGLLALGIDVDRDYTYGYSEEYMRGTATPFPSDPAPRYAQPPVGWRWR